MIKQLLVSAAVATMAFCASAETKVLWTADAPEGDPIEGWNTFYEMTAEECAVFNAGDVIYITVTAKGEGGWPQVALFYGDQHWPPFVNDAAGSTFPNKIGLALTPDDVEQIHERGMMVKGESVYVSEISYEPSTIKVDPNAVWIGPKECGWGNGVGISADVFADVAPGAKIIVEYDTEAAEHTLQFLFGGWSGANIPTYANPFFFTFDNEAGTITVNMLEELSKLTWDVEGEEVEYDLFTLLKEGGLTLHGPCTINQVIYLPAGEEPGTGIATVGNENAPAVYYNLQGVKVAHPENGKIYIVKKGSKVSKVAF